MTEVCDISVIVPCYNANRYLNICLESLKAQRTPNIEMISIDDGSTGCDRGDSRRFCPNGKPRQGGARARRGRFGGAEPRHFDGDGAVYRFCGGRGRRAGGERAVDSLSGRDAYRRADHVGQPYALRCGEGLPGSGGNRAGSCRSPRRSSARLSICTASTTTCGTSCMSASCLRMGWRLDENVRIGEDALLNLQLYLRAKNIAHIPDRTDVYRVHGRSAMANMGLYSEAPSADAQEHERDSAA